MVTRLLDTFMPTIENNATEARISADEFVVCIIKPLKEPTNIQDFCEGEKVGVDRLLKPEIWTVREEGDVKPGSITTGCRFTMTRMNYNISEEKAKVRFVAKGFDDRDKSFIFLHTFILGSLSIRMVLSSATYHGFCIFSHVVTQAYLQSMEKLTRDLYIRVKKSSRSGFGIKHDDILEREKPLYRLCDAGNY